MTMTMDELMKVLDMQEDILQFTHFTNADAWELGTMILMEARRRGAQVGIMIRRSNGEVVFQYCDNGITPHNVELMRRKSNSVLLTERSSLQLYMAATNAPESVKQMVLDPKEYAMLGGGFPICVEEVGVVATVAVSGMGQVSDHDVIVKKINPKIATVAKIPRFCAAIILTASFAFSVNFCAEVIATSFAFLLCFAA